MARNDSGSTRSKISFKLYNRGKGVDTMRGLDLSMKSLEAHFKSQVEHTLGYEPFAARRRGIDRV